MEQPYGVKMIHSEADLLSLKFHQEGTLAYNIEVRVLRVINGWVYIIGSKYRDDVYPVFVPETVKAPPGGKLQKVLNDIQIAVGPWLSASQEDPNTCDDMKQDVERFFKIIEEAEK